MYYIQHLFIRYVSLIFTPIQGGGPELTIQGGGKNGCATYFGHISSMEARIFMKFETYDHKIVLDHQPNFHKDPCKDEHTRGENARVCDALQRFRSESTKIKRMCFSASFEWTQKKVILFTFVNQAKIL